MGLQNSFSEIYGERDPEHDIIEEVNLCIAPSKKDANERREEFRLDVKQDLLDCQRRKNASIEVFLQQNDKLEADFESEMQLRQHNFRHAEKKQEYVFQEEPERRKRNSNNAEHVSQIEHKSQQILKNGVSSTRRLDVFEGFPHLPQELQIIIWRMAAEDKNADRHSFVNYGNQDAISRRSIPRGVSSVISMKYMNDELIEPENKLSGNRNIPAVLHACSLAREVAETVYTCLPIDYDETSPGEALSRQAYFDLVNDEFLLPWKMTLPRLRWTEHQIIVDLLIRHNATKEQWESLPVTLRKHVETLSKIRNLQMDLRTFYNVPPHIWEEFSKLECLTILISPTSSLGDVSVHDRTFKPKPGTKFGKRADWIWGYCYKVLSSVKQDFPDWRHPKIKVHLVDDTKCGETYEEASPEEYDQVHSPPPPGDKLHIPFPSWSEHLEMVVSPTRNTNFYLPERSELDEGDDFEWYRMNRLPKYLSEVTKKDLQFEHRWPFDVDGSEGSS